MAAATNVIMPRKVISLDVSPKLEGITKMITLLGAAIRVAPINHKIKTKIAATTEDARTVMDVSHSFI
jgi:hypothetical protein